MMSVQNVPMRITSLRKEAKRDPAAFAPKMHQRAGLGANFRGSCNCIILDMATDPCMGSGHILVYAFDVLMQIYEAAGYTQREAAKSILENNLYGLDIDDRAFQLAYFAVMMKARQYNRRILNGETDCHVYSIQESNHVDKISVEYFCNGDAKLKAAMDTIISELHDAKEYGSILTVTQQDWSALYDRFAEITEDINMSRDAALAELLPLVQVAETLAQKYDIVVTNPPYMGASGMSGKLSFFVKKKYPNTKSDMSTIMMERTLEMCDEHGYVSMINIPVWMFLSSYEKMRNIMLHNNMIINMVHPGRGIFGSDFGTTTFVVSKTRIINYIGQYYRLFDSQGEVHSADERKNAFLSRKGLHTIQQENFAKIPGMPIAYWLHHQIFEMYGNYSTMAEIALPKVGMQTSNNDKYLRLWYEVNFSEFGGSSH